VFNFVTQINKGILKKVSRVVFLTWKRCLLKNISEKSLAYLIEVCIGRDYWSWSRVRVWTVTDWPILTPSGEFWFRKYQLV